MKKIYKILILVLICLTILPTNVKAISKDYEDLLYKIVDKKEEEEKVNLYFFHSKTCPHCRDEKEFLLSIKDKYKNLNIYMFEVSDSKNYSYMQKAKSLFKESRSGVPYTVIGKENFLGYNGFYEDKIEETIQMYLDKKIQTEKEKNTFNLPIVGEINAKEVSIPFIAIVLGLIDGFNPCAMWILLLLINMFFGMKNKNKMFLYGYTFLFTSALVYFLSMLGISFVLDISAVKIFQILIGIVALIAGVLNIRTFIKTKNDTGCHVVDSKKRKKIFKKVDKILKEEKIFIALIGIIALAVSVNLVELACSLGFPAIFSEILSLNKITGAIRIIYLIIYVLFYMIDDLVVFTIAVCTLSISAKSTKYTKYVNLIAGIIMILIGVLLMIKPEWVMFNF